MIRKLLLATVIILFSSFNYFTSVNADTVSITALPTNPVVSSGSATFNQNVNKLTINQSSNQLITNWSSFNIGRNAGVEFVQPSASSSALNHVNSSDPSHIYGTLQSNGQVILINPNGVIFNGSARVDVGSIIASSLQMQDTDFLNNNYVFEKDGVAGNITNNGTINAFAGGAVALISNKVSNNGIISADQGSVALLSGDKVTLTLNGNSLVSYDIDQGTLDSFIENNNAIKVGSGQVILSAKALEQIRSSVVNNSGTIEAKGLVSSGGKIFLEGDEITVSSTAKLDASGKTGGGKILVGGSWQNSDTSIRQAIKTTVESGAILDASANETGNGGEIVAWSDIKNSQSSTKAYGTFLAKGGASSGDGGRIETSGYLLDVDNIQVDASSTNGDAGLWLLDPHNITIGTSESGTSYANSFTASATSNILASDISSALVNNNVSISTGTDNSGSSAGVITVSNDISKASGAEKTLTLDGNRNIVLNANISGASGSPLNVIISTGSGALTGASNLVLEGGDLSIEAGGDGTYSGVFSGAGNLTKTGDGTQTLSGTNTHTGSNIISAGTLSVAGDRAFGAVPGSTDADNITFVSSGSGIINASGNFTLNTKRGITLTGNGTIDVNNSRTLTYGGIATGSGRLTKTSAGTLSLGGVNTYTGGTTITLGTIILNGANRLYSTGEIVFANAAAILNLDGNHNTIGRINGGGSNSQIQLGGGNLTINLPPSMNGNFAGKITGTGSFIKTGYGGQRLSNSTHDYSGTTTINRGAINIIASSVLPDGTVVTLLNNGSLKLWGDYTQTLAGLISSASNTKVHLKNPASNLIINNSSNIAFAGVIKGSGYITKAGAGSLTLSGTNTYIGGTLINAGSLILGAANVLSDNTWVQLANTDGAILNLNDNNDTIGAILGGGTTGGNIILGSGNLTINQIYRFGATVADQNTTYAGVISGTGSITKKGYGYLTLTGNNTYTGTTSVSAGALIISGSGNISNNSAVTVASGSFLKFSKSVTVGSIAGAGKIQLNGNATTLTAGDNDTNTTFSGVLSGGGVFVKNGSGTLTLSGTNTHYGKLSINEGGITLGASNVIHDKSWVSLANTSGVNLNLNGNNDTIGSLVGGGATGGNIILGSGNLTINQIYRFGASVAVQDTTYAGVISGAGSVTKKGYGSITFTAANTYTGGTVINKGGLRINVNNGLAANRAISISGTGYLYIHRNKTITTSALAVTANARLWIHNGATVNVDQSTDTEMAGTMFGYGEGSNKGKLRKTGDGTFNVTGTNNITVESY